MRRGWLALALVLACTRETVAPSESPQSSVTAAELPPVEPLEEAAPVAVVVACPEDLAEILGVIEGLEWVDEGWRLGTSSYVSLERIAAVLQRHPEIDILIEGHVDAQQSDLYLRQKPSQRRAEAVRDYLLHQGIDPQRIHAVGYGVERPIADNRTPEGRALNERVELVAINCDAKVHTVSEGASAGDCARCHAEVVEQWRGSAHASAWIDPLVAREYQAQPDARCVGCHAPRTAAGEQPSGIAARDGVDCPSCHAPTLATARASDEEACGRCHQFRFMPVEAHGQPTYDTDAWLQDTLGEWLRSDAAAKGIGCVDCHMPEGSHAFPGMSDARLLATAVEVSVSARRAGEAVIVDAQLRPGVIGHAFPTGDMFRAAVLRVWTDGPNAEDEFVLKRWFAAAPVHDDAEPIEVVEVADTRLHGEPLFVELRLRAAAARRVHWSLQLRAAGRDGPDPLERRVTIREGDLDLVSAP